jgi:nitrate/nitrite transport system ATP-binding protein
MAFLELQQVTKSFATRAGRRLVLDGVNLSVEEGEFIAIVGYSGSGKTTLISLIAGLLMPDAGRLTLQGRPIEGPGLDRGVIFQTYSLLPWMSAFDNVHLAVAAASPGLSRAEQRARTTDYLRLVRLEHAAWKRPQQLSGGMRQRVAVARGLAMDPKVLLLDEPFSALDALTRATLQEELARVWEQHRKTVILITNDVDEAVLLADRIHPLTPGPGAQLGEGIRVDIPRPRRRRELSLSPAYQRVRRELVEFLTRRREPALVA